jgi:Protein of unknown function (DUF3138)
MKPALIDSPTATPRAKHRMPPVALAVALLAASLMPAAAWADTNDELLKELRALKARVAELEKKVEEQAAAPKGMTPEQQQDFNRIAVKAEAMEDSRDSLGFKGLKISGYMDPTFIYNQRQNRAGFQFLNNVSDDLYNYDNSYFGAAVIDFTKETEGGSRWRLTLAPNRGVGAVFNGNSPIHEASVSIPITDLQTRFIAGQIPDWSGYEYLQPTLNKLITHNLLFDFTLPTAYTGAGLELTRDKWLIKGMLANVNASKRAADRTAPALVYRVDYAKGEFQGFGFAGMHGRAPNLSEGISALGDPLVDETGTPIDAYVPGTEAQSDSMAHLFEFDAYFIRGDWTVQGQLSYGQQRKASITPDPVTGDLRSSRWWGLSSLVAYKFEPRLEGTVRYDYLNNRKNGGGLFGYAVPDDRNGIGPAMVQDANGTWVTGDAERGVNRQALTFGISYLFNQSTTLKAEYRLDRASGAVFKDVKTDGFKKTNQLLGASVLVSF